MFTAKSVLRAVASWIPRGEKAVVYAICGTSLVLNLALIMQGRTLRATVTSLRAVTNRHTIEVGDVVTEFTGTGQDGKVGIVSLAGQETGTIIYVFAPTCHWCSRNWENVAAVNRGIGSSYHIVGVSPPDERLKEYVAKRHITFPVYTIDLNMKLGKSGKVFAGVTPQTIVADRAGRIIQVWSGAYDGSLGHIIATFFGVSLPGLAPEARGG